MDWVDFGFDCIVSYINLFFGVYWFCVIVWYKVGEWSVEMFEFVFIVVLFWWEMMWF